MFEPEIVFEDNIYIVINKPAGMPTQGTEKNNKEDLYSLTQKFLSQRDGKEVYLALHHRLDAQTSGLILFCKHQHYNKYTTDLFREKRLTKKYIALCEKNKDIEVPENWSIENKITEYKIKHFKRAKSSQNGKPALTDFRVLSQNENQFLIECFPKTGRLHQIRVHLSEFGLPLIGDFHYNKNYKGKDFSLCAYYLRFRHPKSKEMIELKIKPPFMEDLSLL